MKPATWPRDEKLAERLLWVDPRERTFGDARVGDLARLMRPRDLLVVNDAGVLPASLMGHTESGAGVEARLVGPEDGLWRAVMFGAGDWRQRTEERPIPRLTVGSRVGFGRELAATVSRVIGDRVVLLAFNVVGDAFWNALYRHGRPVQYAYTRSALSLFHVQTVYAGEPWSVEMPSAGRPLTAALLLSLRARGVQIARLTHAAGLSSTGDSGLDATLPWPERYKIPEETVRAVQATRDAGGRIIAVGTTVVRALEGAADGHPQKVLSPGPGVTNLIIGPGFTPRVVNGLFTGIHEPSASHFALLAAFAPRELLLRAYEHAERGGYLGHEFGDSCLIMPGRAFPHQVGGDVDPLSETTSWKRA